MSKRTPMTVGFLSLLGASVVSGLGDQMNRIAVLTVVYASTHSGLAVSFSIAIRMAAYVAAGPVGAVLADRLPRKLLMVSSDVVRAGLAISLCWVGNRHHLITLFVVIAFIEAFSAVFTPARAASLPRVVGEDHITWANNLDESANGLVMALGSLIGGVAVAGLGPSSAFLLNSTSFVMSALLILRVRVGPPCRSGGQSVGLGPALRLVRERPVLRSAVALYGLWPIAGGALSVLLTVYAFGTFSAGQVGVGLLYGALGVGYLSGGVIARIRTDAVRSRGLPLAAVCYAIEGLLYALASQSPGIAVASALLAVGSTFAAVGNAGISSVLLRESPDAVRGRVIGISRTLGNGSQISSMMLAGAALNLVSARVCGLVSGSLLTATSLLVVLTAPSPASVPRREQSGVG